MYIQNAVIEYINFCFNTQKTPKGLAWFAKWASNRYSANSAYILLLAADYGIMPEETRDWALGQVGI